MRVELELEELPLGSRRLVRAGTVEVAVFNLDGEIFAVNNVCPHRGGPLIRGLVQRTEAGPFVRCPMHGWAFCMTSGASVRPGRAIVYPVALHGERIAIEVEAGPFEVPR